MSQAVKSTDRWKRKGIQNLSISRHKNNFFYFSHWISNFSYCDFFLSFYYLLQSYLSKIFNISWAKNLNSTLLQIGIMFRVCSGIGTITPKTNNPNPESVRFRKEHRETKPTTRLLCVSIIFTNKFNRWSSLHQSQ